MSEPGSSSGLGSQSGYGPTHTPFPVTRLLYALGFGVAAWFVFWILMVIGIVQFVMMAVNGRVHEELRSFAVNLIQYMWELTAYITFVRDEQPFPVGPFPARR